jgi:carboxyl-terminal processing protease
MPRRWTPLAAAAWLLGLVLGWVAPAAAVDSPRGEPAAARAPEAPDPDGALQAALDLERQRQWATAIDAYEQALRRWPDRVEFRHRLRLCEAHYRLSRRYQDRSFRNILLRMPEAQALELYGEVLERVATHYVEPVAMAPLLRRGLDNLEVALRDPVFLDANVPGADASRVLALRKAYQVRRSGPAPTDRDGARTFVVDACNTARRTLGLNATPVILEFIYGTCDVLDEYSGYLTPDKLDDLYAVIDGNFVGLGVELKADPSGLRLVGVIAGGPAAEHGLKAGETITRIGGRSVAGQGLDEAAGQLQGAEGTAIDLTVRDAAGRVREVRLVRRPVEVRSVPVARMVDSLVGVGYVQLTGFQKTSTDELRRAIAGLQRSGMRFLVLDLRGNPGGLLDVAVEIADEFLDRGTIVSTRGRAGNQNVTYPAHTGAPWRMPVAVLVDHDSASASEILAGALKDNRRALVIGETSYGKGSVQSIFPLRAAPAGLKLTTAKFYSPLNQSYSEQGVQPDVAVRVAARPPGDGEAPAFEPGDPAHDAALASAIAQARRRLSAAR